MTADESSPASQDRTSEGTGANSGIGEGIVRAWASDSVKANV